MLCLPPPPTRTASASLPPPPHSLLLSPVSVHVYLLAHHHPLHPLSYPFIYIVLYAPPILLLRVLVPRDVVMRWMS
jgi:hypothetical protein